MTQKLFGRRAIVLSCLGLVWQAPASAVPQLEEVIVTAEKREEWVQDVPISIAAFSEDTLEKLGITDIKLLGSNVPHVAVNEFTGASTSINLVTRQADPSGLSFKQTLTGGNYDLFRSRLSFGDPRTYGLTVQYEYFQGPAGPTCKLTIQV